MMTIEKVKELAMKNYEKGGDVVIECYEDYQIENLIDIGINTEDKLLKWFQSQHEIDEEYRKAANWHTYGTTNEEKIKEMLHSEQEPEIPEDIEIEDEIPSYEEEEYCPSATGGDYSPSNPWNAPGMSERDFL